jgi:CheY-like chemotaxis protein
MLAHQSEDYCASRRTVDTLVVGRHEGVIFIADDEPAILKSLEIILEHHGYLVLPARNGREALARMRGITSAALAIVDLSMPVMDGHKLIAAMRDDKELSEIPIVVASGHRRQVTGADCHLLKPFKLEQLMWAVRAFLPKVSTAAVRTQLPPIGPQWEL